MHESVKYLIYKMSQKMSGTFPETKLTSLNLQQYKSDAKGIHQ